MIIVAIKSLKEIWEDAPNVSSFEIRDVPLQKPLVIQIDSPKLTTLREPHTKMHLLAIDSLIDNAQYLSISDL